MSWSVEAIMLCGYAGLQLSGAADTEAWELAAAALAANKAAAAAADADEGMPSYAGAADTGYKLILVALLLCEDLSGMCCSLPGGWTHILAGAPWIPGRHAALNPLNYNF